MIELLKQMADAGKFSHLSVYAQWGAHNSPTVFHASFITPYGQGHADNTDPVAAIVEAVEKAPKQAQRHSPVVDVRHNATPDNRSHETGEPLAPAPVMGSPSNAP